MNCHTGCQLYLLHVVCQNNFCKSAFIQLGDKGWNKKDRRLFEGVSMAASRAERRTRSNTLIHYRLFSLFHLLDRQQSTTTVSNRYRNCPCPEEELISLTTIGPASAEYTDTSRRTPAQHTDKTGEVKRMNVQGPGNNEPHWTTQRENPVNKRRWPVVAGRMSMMGSMSVYWSWPLRQRQRWERPGCGCRGCPAGCSAGTPACLKFTPSSHENGMDKTLVLTG